MQWPRLESPSKENGPIWQRLGWLGVIWTASVMVLGIVAWLIRLALA